MYKARFLITRGIGKEYRTVSSDTYKGLMEKVEMATIDLTTVPRYTLGQYLTYTIQGIKFFYPSGKTYTKTF